LILRLLACVPGNNLPLSEIPRGAYTWSLGAEVDLSDYEDDAAYRDSEGPEYMRWEERDEDGFDESGGSPGFFCEIWSWSRVSGSFRFGFETGIGKCISNTVV
jgi:hypothetical protein